MRRSTADLTEEAPATQEAEYVEGDQPALDPPAQEQPPSASGQNAQKLPAAHGSSSGAAEPVSENVVPFPGVKKKRGRPKKTGDNYRVDYVRASTNTWAFRIRWTEPSGDEPAVYVSRVSNKLFKMITKGKVRYAAFKKQLISGYKSGAIRQSYRTDAGSDRAV
jgi:hypothetical protein